MKKIPITSEAFEDGDSIPARYTCDGENISPAVSWEGVPESSKSIALIMDDPDAPGGMFVHWVVYNIPKDSRGFEEGVPGRGTLSDGSVQGLTDFGRVGYGGPCPPSGTHRYFFKIYALDKKLDLPPKATKEDVEEAMEGHVLAKGEIMGRCRR